MLLVNIIVADNQEKLSNFYNLVKNKTFKN